MENVIASLTTSVSATNLWTEVGHAVPLIAVGVLFGLGYYIVKKATKGLSRAKQRM